VIRIVKDYDKNIVIRDFLIFFRHFVERPPTIFTWSTVIGQNSWNRYIFLKWFLLVILRIC